VETRECDAAQLYLDLMKKCLTRLIFPDIWRPTHRPSMRHQPFSRTVYPLLTSLLAARGLKLFRYTPFDPVKRAEGIDWPQEAHTMVGLKRLENLTKCIEEVLRKDVPGDLIETGVWRGGSCIFMRAVLKAHGERTRLVWVADSFEGLPKPDGRYDQDIGDQFWKYKSILGVSLEEVKANFELYDLLDEQVRFLPGWFKDTLPTAPINQLAVLRLDGDMYSSTMDVLENLYSKLSPGGYAIIDDYGAVSGCKEAVEEFRSRHNITAHLERIDDSGVFWEKPG